MNILRRGLAALPECVWHVWSSACMIRIRYGSGLFALPLCSSVCLFGLRIVLAAAGVSV
ncbi:hypothetical protein [Caballeronia grimmiae]|uniref:hypothetical protein n=1 Tax=Caballeronia grimmiae TaxID=1071679 RepID=UPI000A71D91D|nr:hypothetical protein [Caballeronia grimmiae]